MTKKTISTFEREMKNRKFKKSFEKGYKEFLLSELLIAMMDGDEKSIRELSKEVGLSATIIQRIRSRKQSDIKISNFVNIVGAYGYNLVLEKGKERILIRIDSKHHLNFAYAH